MLGSSPLTAFPASVTRDVFILDLGLNWHSTLFLASEPHVPMETHSTFKAEPCCSAGYLHRSHPLTPFHTDTEKGIFILSYYLR